jgi:hypothetical protein
MDPASIITIVSGVIAIVQAFSKGAVALQEWRKKRKQKKTCEEELQNSLEAGGPTVISEYKKCLAKYGEVFNKGDGMCLSMPTGTSALTPFTDISKLSLMKTKMHLDLAVVEVLLKVARAPQDSMKLDPLVLYNISEQAGKSALTAMAELCQRIHVRAPVSRSSSRHQEALRSPSSSLSTITKFADQPAEAFTLGTAESIADEDEQRDKGEPTCHCSVDPENLRAIAGSNCSAVPSTLSLPRQRARKPASLQIPRQMSHRPAILPLQIPQHSLTPKTLSPSSIILYSAPPAIRSFSDPFSAQVCYSPFSPSPSIRSFSSQPTSARLESLSSRVSTPTRSTVEILREAAEDEATRWAALDSPRSPNLHETCVFRND